MVCEECECSPEPCSEHDPLAYALYLEWAARQEQRDRTHRGVRLAWAYASGLAGRSGYDSRRLALNRPDDLDF